MSKQLNLCKPEHLTPPSKWQSPSSFASDEKAFSCCNTFELSVEKKKKRGDSHQCPCVASSTQREFLAGTPVAVPSFSLHRRSEEPAQEEHHGHLQHQLQHSIADQVAGAELQDS
jgi:hypothetical protein